jgi:uncharacterized BrkB/YihY/UPF0761 family membrane protein
MKQQLLTAVLVMVIVGGSLVGLVNFGSAQTATASAPQPTVVASGSSAEVWLVIGVMVVVVCVVAVVAFFWKRTPNGGNKQ